MRSKFIALTALLLISFFISSAQDGSYYVVIGAFEIESNAQRFRDHAHRLNIPAIYSFNSAQKLFYVYVRNTLAKGDAYGTLRNVQGEGFRDAWVFKGVLESSSTWVQHNEAVVTEEVKTSVADVSEPGIEPLPQNVVKSEEDSSPVEASPMTIPADATVKPAGKAFMFKVFNDATGNPVNGQVRLQETDRSNQFRGYGGNELVYIVAPGNRNGRWYVVCQVVGFKPFKTQINFSDPQKDGDVEIGNEQEIIVPIRLSRVKRGDYIEMDEVRFFNHSDVFTPGSKRELTELLAMMQENPEYKIRVHGHTNGNDGREIVLLGQSTDFFAVSPGNERRSGSARELSEHRAEAVKKYLVSNGVDASRILVKGEAGKQPIFDPKGTTAGGNDRVEVEILKH